jgi:hypothetical protein
MTPPDTARVAVAGNLAMNEHTTPSILQRVPVILAVTAASYGLPTQAQANSSTGQPRHLKSSVSTSSCSCPEEPARDNAATQH